MSTLRRLLHTARAVTRDAAALVASRLRDHLPIETRTKGQGDFVTDVDLRVEERLQRELRARHPTHGFVGEERGAERADADYVWVVDPVDGTSNFARGLRAFGVAVACLHRRAPVAAAVACWPGSVLYSAALGLGAFCERRRLRIRPASLDVASILGVQWLREARELPFLPAVLRTGARIRNFGSSVVQLCDVAAGRLDANLQEQGKVWDIAAPGLVVTEAGGRFTDWAGGEIFPFASLSATGHHPSLAAPPGVHGQLVRVLRGS